ncbi:formylglycine-generating enzyme family protein [Magnetococcales bacterium HHB-1]
MRSRYATTAALMIILAVIFSSIKPVSAFLINEWEPIEGLRQILPSKKAPIPGTRWKENITGMTFLWIPKGCYFMGTLPHTEGRDADEGPRHRICLPGFWLSQHEVTQQNWWQVMRYNPAHFRTGKNYPVERVSWEDAEIFMQRLNSYYPDANYQFRLPLEVEWEYACRSGGDSERFAGSFDPLSVAWFKENSGGETHTIGSLQKNRFGLMDMNGNVREWTLNIYHAQLYAFQQAQKQVVLNIIPQRGQHNEFRVVRGGGWQSNRRELRCSNRAFEHFASKQNNLGLRIALSTPIIAKKVKPLLYKLTLPEILLDVLEPKAPDLPPPLLQERQIFIE